MGCLCEFLRVPQYIYTAFGVRKCAKKDVPWTKAEMTKTLELMFESIINNIQ